jgi:endoglucanase
MLKLTSNNYTPSAEEITCFKNKTLLFFACLFAACLQPFVLSAQSVSDRIKLNQLGFYSHAPKVAIVTGPITENSFFVTSSNARDTLFRGSLTVEQKSINSSTLTRIADFSAFTTRGSYVLLVQGVGHSYVFTIGNQVNQPAAISSLKGFYYQRVSMALLPQYAGKWHRSAGHPDMAVYIHPSAATSQRPAGSTIASPGGWYDAGDYNKYIVNSGITMGTLLSAYEDFPRYFQALKTNIPESNDAVPDVLNEIIYNLRWMLTMQDPYDVGVNNKCTNAQFEVSMHGKTNAPR